MTEGYKIWVRSYNDCLTSRFHRKNIVVTYWGVGIGDKGWILIQYPSSELIFLIRHERFVGLYEPFKPLMSMGRVNFTIG